MFVLAGCGANPPAEAAVEERTYPGSDEVADRLEEAGYYVEQYDEFEELGIAASRVKAAAGDDYLDILTLHLLRTLIRSWHSIQKTIREVI